MLGLEPGDIRVVPYSDVWPALFAAEKERLVAAVWPHVLAIEHVGSTSVPGLAAKPILDIAVAVTNFEEAAVCIRPLERLGYVYRGENGIPRRHYFQLGDPRTHHLHLNEIDSVDWHNLILLRDYLRRYPAAAADYASLKNELAARHSHDREAYTLAKAPFIGEILRKARQEFGLTGQEPAS